MSQVGDDRERRVSDDREREPTVTGSTSCKGGSVSRDDQEHELAMTGSASRR